MASPLRVMVGGRWMPSVSPCSGQRPPQDHHEHFSCQFCAQGKQAQNREGFYWCVPSTFTTGLRWVEGWLESYSALSDEQKTNCGCASMREGPGFPWVVWRRPRSICSKAWLSRSGTPPPTFRRLAPTMGHMLRLDPEELVALGDWQEKSEVAASKAAMPLHYSAARYAQSMRGKHRVLQLVGEIATYEAWELVPDNVLARPT